MRFVLCDDNEIFITKLYSIIENIFLKLNINAEILKLIKSPFELLEFLDKNDVDVVFLDIKFDSKMSGIDVANKIREKNKNIYIIFITGHFEYSMLAYKVKTFDYLIKPISQQKLEETIQRLYDDFYQRESRFINLCKGKYLIKESDILYIEKSRTKAIIHSNNTTLEIYETLDKIQKNLPENFIRCHKSYLINSNKISRIDNKNNTFYIGNIPILYSKNFVNLERMVSTNGRDLN